MKFEIIDAINLLVPGLIAMWIFYGLTPHPKPPHAEQVMQALIFTLLAQLFMIPVRGIFYLCGLVSTFSEWPDSGESLLAAFGGFSLGLLLSACANNDYPHSLFRRKTLTWREKGENSSAPYWTQKNSYPHEWHAVFAKDFGYATLHLADERMLHGWIKQYPDDPFNGFFYITNLSWIKSDGSESILKGTRGMLVPAKEVVLLELFEDPTSAATEDSDDANDESINTSPNKIT
ncbi:hypothetical protein Pla110_29150 [Polystyrenella longa]|uniref:Uncharacterized protein n=1 Tax=Polystyrenella longa TaxID=2528007 RepID=A0A518CPL3_9PLAN|nr:DUF6338 family protein [Polystyrenella longa]QDU81177.1 hypothetical protein Pla110_29150 [Polystyrenella longa]